MSPDERAFFLRVLTPRAILPQGVLGAERPNCVRPSPPPCAWSRGFIAVPRTPGRTPILRCRPAFPIVINPCSGFETARIEAHPVDETIRTSLEGRVMVVCKPSCAITIAPTPAERASTAPQRVQVQYYKPPSPQEFAKAAGGFQFQ